jgi:hypothetical protein
VCYMSCPTYPPSFGHSPWLHAAESFLRS